MVCPGSVVDEPCVAAGYDDGVEREKDFGDVGKKAVEEVDHP